MSRRYYVKISKFSIFLSPVGVLIGLPLQCRDVITSKRSFLDSFKVGVANQQAPADEKLARDFLFLKINKNTIPANFMGVLRFQSKQ